MACREANFTSDVNNFERDMDVMCTLYIKVGRIQPCMTHKLSN